MKKIIIALGMIAMAIGVQAASVNWSLNGAGSDYKTGNMLIYAFEGDVTTAAVAALSSTEASDWSTFLSVEPKTISKRGAATGSVSGYTKGETSYLTFVVVDTAIAEGNAWRVIAAADVTGNVYEGADTPSTFYSNLASVSASGTFESVPEPTSGLLLLLGMAGLALKRKQA